MKRESGQVLISGVIMVTLLLLGILFIFDVHNVIRAKLKLETGLQAASLTGAAWQKNSLNLIGEINIFKACSALLEGEENWEHPLTPAPAASPGQQSEDEKIQAEKRRRELQGRIDLLTEMQTRVAFIGPLIGFASAQQAAFANGLPAASSSAMRSYLNRVINSYRYREDFGGADDVINNYRWRDPYISLLEEITARGIAVYPNVRTAQAPVVDPQELGNGAFYADIIRHAEEIAAGDPPEQTSWHDTLYRFAKNYQIYDDSVLQGKWWSIDFTLNRFPDECEIFTLGVRNGFSRQSGYSHYDDYTMKIGNTLFNAASGFPGEQQNSVYRSMGDLPQGVNMRWFCYDESWYPDYYRSVASDYDRNHYNYWFNKQVLRREVKKQYRYEGPAAYTESSDIYIDRVVRQRVSRARKSNFLYQTGERTILVGSKHSSSAEDESYSTGYRPGVIAKALGELSSSEPPIAVPLVLPVFNRVVLMPTYMPIPYSFSVLRDYNSILDDFLNWLAAEDTLLVQKNPLPPSCELFLEALQNMISRKKFLNYGYNPDCTVKITREMLLKWDQIRKDHLYAANNSGGLGWLQEPKICSDPSVTTPPEVMEQIVPDLLNGGEAIRIYLPGSFKYYVIDSGGRVITNDDLDPTIRYGSDYNTGPGGPGFGTAGNLPDLEKGPVRL